MANSKLTTLSKLLLLFLSASLIYSHDDIHCSHKGDEFGHELLEVEELGFDPSGGRLLQDATYPNIRMTSDVSLLSVNGSESYVNYTRDTLIPPVFDFLQSALRVRYPLTQPLKITQSQLCDINTPTVISTTGVSTDFYAMFVGENSTETWAATTSVCYLASGTKRPLFARVKFNLGVLTETADPLNHEKNMYLLIHEVIHALGFSGSMFKYFISDAGVTLTTQFAYRTIDGQNRTFINVPALTNRLRTYYGCSTLPGGLLEEDGESGTAGTHFERKTFLYDVLTSGVIHGRRVSEFTLAMLESSGWYTPNYTYAEPFFAGQGQGCTYTYGSCNASSYNFDEFCKHENRGCTAVGRGGGKCLADTKADDCKFIAPSWYFDCENPAAANSSRLASIQAFGRDAGSKCFSGNLSTKTSDTQNSFCFTYTCKGSGLTQVVELKVGNATINCTTEGNVTVTGYKGFINCPDPIQFCKTVGVKYCPRNCMGRGNCINGVCVCKTGFEGKDCSSKKK